MKNILQSIEHSLFRLSVFKIIFNIAICAFRDIDVRSFIVVNSL